MRWLWALVRNAGIGAFVYSLVLGGLVGLSAASGATQQWTSGWEAKLLSVWLFAAGAGGFVGAGCTRAPRGGKRVGFLIMASCLIGGTIVLYGPLARVSSGPATTLLMLAMFFVGPGLLARRMTSAFKENG